MNIILALVLSNPVAPWALKPAGASAFEEGSSFQKRNARVRHALVNFNLPQHPYASLPPNTSPFDLYEKQVLRGFTGPMADPGSLSAGVALFAAMTVVAARAPGPLRILIDGPARVGPAILRDGGLGAAIGYRW